MPRRYISRRAEHEIEALLRAERERADREAREQERARNKGDARGAAHSQRRPGDWNGLVEQRILDGMDKGLFDNLAGTGKPLNLDEDQFVPDELKMAFRMLRSTGLTPLWIEVNREIRADIDRLHRFRDLIHQRWSKLNAIELAHRRAEYIERIESINSKILSYNIMAPSVQVHIHSLLVHEELERFDQPEPGDDTER